MSALVAALTAFGVTAFIAGGIYIARVVQRAARIAACAPMQELDLNKRASARASCVLAFALAALGIAVAAKDLVQGDATWRDMAGLELGYPLVAALALYASNRWLYFPHAVFGLRAQARGVVTAGDFLVGYALACTQCGGASDSLRTQMTATDARVVWKCRQCGNVNVAEPVAPCLTSASS